MKSFAVILICYNRIVGVKRLLKELEKVDYDGRKDINLVFSIDNSESRIVENFANEYNWPHGEKRIRTFANRQGLKNHILRCGDFTSDYDIIALFEDDIFVSDSFYHYAYNAAKYYWDDDRIAGISLYGFQKNWLNWIMRFEPERSPIYDNYFLRVAQSWGQVWTKQKWENFMSWYKNNQIFVKSDSIPEYLNTWQESSWLKYHDRYCIETSRYFVYPYVSLTTNYSDPGEHAYDTVNDYQVELQYGKKHYVFSSLDDASIRYDEYMDRQGLGKYIDTNEDELQVDFWNTKKKNSKRYLLTTAVLDYTVVKSFSLSIRPIEMSVIRGIDGDGIYLYDTQSKEACSRNCKTNDELIAYSLRTHDWRELLPFALRLTLKEIRMAVIRRIKKRIRR